ncbi:MAG: biopolymer transporter ExbD [Gemmatimonadetes bacterium]|nr:biopolymer transporter ExbD [Gemmatimonadota bacterium]
MAMLQPRSKVSSDIPSASMADIAFLLLIFFLSSTVFNEEQGLPIVLPEAAEEVAVAQKNILHLIVQPNGLVEVKRGESVQTQQVSPDDLEAIWRQEVAANPNLIAAVKTHPDASYRFMVDVLDALQSASAERISLQLLEGR